MTAVSTVISIHAPPRGAARALSVTYIRPLRFQSTLPSREATPTSLKAFNEFIFQSTLPSRGATMQRTEVALLCQYFNPRSPRGERHDPTAADVLLVRISIHAPLAGSDPLATPWACLSINFNPRSPRGERPVFNLALFILDAFQSTLPSRGATPLCALMRAATIFQSTLPSRGATRARWVKITNLSFQSTLPSRGATAKMHKTSQQYCQLHPKTVLHAACMRL